MGNCTAFLFNCDSKPEDEPPKPSTRKSSENNLNEIEINISRRPIQESAPPEPSLITIQSAARGYLTRKQFNERKYENKQDSNFLKIRGTQIHPIEEAGVESVEDFAIGDSKYTGQMKDAKRHGLGTQISPDNTKYEGQ